MNNSNSTNMRQQFANTMLELGTIDKNLIVMVGDISHGIFGNFAKMFPERYFNIGILEPTMISLGAGMSNEGLFPVIHTIAPFIVERSFEQLKLDFCYHNLGGNIITVGSAFDYSNLGCTHHCYNDFGLLKTLPNTEIFFPTSCDEFDVLFRENYKNGKLNIFRLPTKLNNFYKYSIKNGTNILQEGEDVTLIFSGPHFDFIKEAIENFSNKITFDLIYINNLSLLDQKLIKSSIDKTKKFIVIEEHFAYGGLFDEVIKIVYEISDLRGDSINLGKTFIRKYGSYQDLLNYVGLNSENLIKKINKLISAS